MKHYNLIFTVILLLFSTSMSAQENKIEVNLWPDGAPQSNGITTPEKVTYGKCFENISTASMTVYPSAKPGSKAIIMCPGGGYAAEWAMHEGHSMAAWFHSLNVTFIVLKYRLPNFGHYEVPLADSQQAIRIVRSRCKEWNVNPDMVGIMGASAGGHLAATTANLFTADTRPDFQILLYPVITMLEGTHQGSCENLLGKNAPESLKKQYSMELRVTDKTPRAFIVLAGDDSGVNPIANSLNYFKALLEHNVPATIHIYPTGNHGFGFKDSFIYKHQWTGELEKWLSTF
ncbi:MAG: alpha/beta hydrolase [Muribaculaceae bacterium]|jgi:acetyl esterase/lipase|nr:alpha/beta hydrolase [Muribaculaceae bacterium]